MRCILGLYSYKGQVELLETTGEKLKQFSIGYLPQKSGTFPGLTVEEQLYYHANLKKMEKEKIQDSINRVLQITNLEEQRRLKGRKLSGGMIRRLGIAQALLDNPNVIVFDEPTAGLDPEERIRFKNIVRSMHKDTIIIMSTHIVEDVEAVCDNILIMRTGEILTSGNQEEICRLAEGKVFEIDRGELTESDYIVKEKEVDGKGIIRVLSNQRKGGVEILPTIEDGYLCILRGI